MFTVRKVNNVLMASLPDKSIGLGIRAEIIIDFAKQCRYIIELDYEYSLFWLLVHLCNNHARPTVAIQKIEPKAAREEGRTLTTSPYIWLQSNLTCFTESLFC